MSAARADPLWSWRSRSPDPARALDADDFERALLALDAETWASWLAKARPTPAARGPRVTGDPTLDAWERAAWAEVVRGE